MIQLVKNADADNDDLYNIGMPDLPKGKSGIPSLPPGHKRMETQGSTIAEDNTICTVVPLQVGSNSIELSIGVGITGGYDVDDENKNDDAIIYGLEIFIKNKWKTVLTKSSNDPTTIFRLDGLQNKPYDIRIRYEYFQNELKCIQFSNKMQISLKVAIIWNNLHHGKNVHFIENHKILCKRGDGHCSIVMDPMIISNSTFKSITFAVCIHKYGNKSCFGFVDYTKYPSLMHGNWDKCYLYVPRKDNVKGIYGLTAQFKSKQLFCCIDGTFTKSIKLKKTKFNPSGSIQEEDHFIFEFIFNTKENNNNICNVYLNKYKDKKCLLLSGSNKITFNNIPQSVVPIYSHEDHGESQVSIKVLNAEFVKK